MLILCHAFVLICARCSCHVQSFVNVSPNCVCTATSDMTWLFIIIGGWNGLLIFQENSRDSDFAGLKRTSHFFAHKSIFSMSELSNCAASVGSSKIIKRLVSSAKRRMLQ